MNTLLFTGASGFLGKNIKPILEKEYKIDTVGLDSADTYNMDISKDIPQLNQHYDVVLHAAGKAHSVPKTEEEKHVFFDVNYQGTVNLCQSLELAGIPKAFIFISTVAVYGCDFGENITEQHPLDGDTPYAVSKRMAEEFLTDWANRNNVVLSIIRPALLAGPNPPGNLGNMIRGIKSNRYLSIGGGKAQKSVLMVQDIAKLIPILSQKGGIYNVCDDERPSFRQLEILISTQLNKKRPMNIPYWIAKLLALLGDCLGKKFPINSLRLDKITKSLTFSNQKIKRELNWTPSNVIENFRITD